MIDLPNAAQRARLRQVIREHKGKPLDPVVLGLAPAPIDDDTLANCCILLAILAKTQPARVAEFFSLSGDRHEKIAFLLRYGHFETWGKQ